MTRERVYALIDAERDRQQEKWAEPHYWGKGDCSSPNVPIAVKVMVLAEEVGEVARAVLDRDPLALADELVQVAAVATAWLEGMNQ